MLRDMSARIPPQGRVTIEVPFYVDYLPSKSTHCAYLCQGKYFNKASQIFLISNGRQRYKTPPRRRFLQSTFN